MTARALLAIKLKLLSHGHLMKEGKRTVKKINTQKMSFPLTGEGIDNISAHIIALLEEIAPRREILRIRLAAEDILNLWQKTSASGTSCTVQFCTRLGQRTLRLSVAGPSVNPNTDCVQSEMYEAGNAILEGLGMSSAPSYRYEKGVNQIEFRVPRKQVNQLVWVALAAVLAVVLGLFTTRLPISVQQFLTEQIGTPVLNVLLGMLTGIAMPMIFCSICTGVLGIGSVATLGKIGKKFLQNFLGMSFVIAFLTVFAIWWLFPISSGGASLSSGFQDIFNMVIQMIPTNLVKPFLEGNALQIIVLGMCLGIVLLVMGKRTEGFANIIRQADDIVAFLMAGISRLLPLFVFFTFFGLIVSSDVFKLGGTVGIIALTSVLCLAMMLGGTVVVCLRLHIPMGELIQKTMPPFLVALCTSSSVAAFPQRLEVCEKHFGMASDVTRFSVSLAQTLFKPGGSIFYCVAALCTAKAYNVPITPFWLMLCVLISAILGIATPPVPGGTKMAYAALFLQLGIPAEGLVLVLAAEPILDFLFTASNSHMQVMVIALTADKLGLLHQEKLASSH
ncbi:MAG: cation:dicarboxylase symporter family transporter [Ruthenibacterium sp.]